MLRYIGRRLIELIPVLLLVTIIVFFVMRLLPGDPVQMMLLGAEGGMATPERIAELRESFGLNDPLPVQFVRFLGDGLRGDLGNSIHLRAPVTEILLDRFPYTFRLSLTSMACAMLLGLALGATAAIMRGSWVDTITMTLSFIGVSMPIFWLGLVLLLLFSIRLRWLPATGVDDWRSIILPTATLSFVSIGVISRITRSSLLDVLGEDYVRTARSKGLAERAVIVRHAAKNALIPVITVMGLQFGNMLAGAVVTETVFSRPGLGRLVVDAILWKDYPLVQGAVLFLALIYCLVNLLVDISYAWFDPRIKFEQRATP